MLICGGLTPGRVRCFLEPATEIRMMLQDAAGNRYPTVRKFGDSRLPTVDGEEDRNGSLAQLYLPDDRLLLPVGNGKFRVAGTDQVLTVVQN